MSQCGYDTTGPGDNPARLNSITILRKGNAGFIRELEHFDCVI